MDNAFFRELQSSIFVHAPLPLHREKSLEAGFPRKRVLDALPLKGAAAFSGCIRSESLPEGYRLTARLRAETWPADAAPDGDYANFGTARLTLSLEGMDWRPFNRLRFQVLPEVPGAHILHLNAAVRNEGEEPLPDPYGRDGATVFDLENHQWNDCVWEFAAMPRDRITELNCYIFLSGTDLAAQEELSYTLRDFTLERVEAPEHEQGWMNPQPGIRLSTVGYFPKGRKTAIATTDASDFSVVREADDTPVFTAPVQTLVNARGRFALLDFSSLTAEGIYRLQAGSLLSEPFAISAALTEESVWKGINFFFCQRCGTPVPHRHGTCHQDIIATHHGVTLSYAGGWHDAGDQSQQTAQTGEITHALFACAAVCAPGLLRTRLMEEGRWGLDFLLRTRFGDGFRASSAGATRYTDNRIGNFDDVPARVHAHAYDNFLLSGVEAHAALTLREEDPDLADTALRCAEEDFAFAQERYARYGLERPVLFEHTYPHGESQLYAARAWAAALLTQATGKETYAEAARRAGAELMACQETGGAGIPLQGFFYRDASHRQIVHFNHQSREHQFVQALDALCQALPEDPDAPRWVAALERYGAYLKDISGNTAPYGMLPAGLHRTDEPEDEALFPLMHLYCDYAREKENYAAQLAAGTPVAPGYVLRNFPVWFSFRGNSAVLLSQGYAAAIAGRRLRDPQLTELAREQLYWIWGKNPFGQSLIYGAGHRYTRQYAVLCGESVGEIPVGVETRGNEDEPFWPQNNNATFREVWGAAVCRFLWICGELGIKEEERK